MSHREFAAEMGLSKEWADLATEIHMRPRVITPEERRKLDLKRKLYDSKLDTIREQTGLSIEERESIANRRTAMLSGVVLNELDASRA